MSKLNETQLQSVKNRVEDIQSVIQLITQTLVSESQTDLVIVPNDDECGIYSIYFGDALMQNVEGSFLEARNVLQGVSKKMRTKREKLRHRIDVLKIELKYYLSLMEE